MANLSRMEELTLKRLLGEIAPKEEEELEEIAQMSDDNRRFIERMHPVAFHERRQAFKPKERHLLAYSIAIFVVLLAGWTLWWLQQPRRSKLEEHGPLQATLVFRHNPEKPVWDSIVLGDIDEGRAYPAGAIQVARIKDQIFIIPWPDTLSSGNDTLAYLLRVYGKGSAQLFIPDVMKSQVGPGSSVSFSIYPSGSTPAGNTVSCDGEAFFDIPLTVQIPTVVKTLKQTITAFGAFFGVRDYLKEDTGAAFCYAGKITVRDTAENTRTLASAQRVTIEAKHAPKVWKDDFPIAKWSSPELPFDFSHLNLDSAMKEISRWYGMSIVQYHDGVNRYKRGDVFTGPLSRYQTLKQLLSLIDRNDLHFRIQGSTIHVSGSTDRSGHNH